MNNEENVNQNDARAILDGSNGKHKICLLSIIGEVEGHENLSGNTKTTKYDQILPKLAQLEDDDSVEGLLVLLNTSGGDVDAGLAIAEMIASLSMPSCWAAAIPSECRLQCQQIIPLLCRLGP